MEQARNAAALLTALAIFDLLEKDIPSKSSRALAAALCHQRLQTGFLLYDLYRQEQAKTSVTPAKETEVSESTYWSVVVQTIGALFNGKGR